MAPQTVGGYEIIRPLGAGGMGQVLLARDPKLERMVALKVLHRDFAVDPTARKRFHREAKSLASLSHPGIVTIHEIGEDQDRDFIVMEFLKGKTLRSEIIEGALGQAEILALAKQIADAIAGAHGAGVLHRDIKPENIMVDADAGITVVDFGLARSFDEVDGGRLPSASSVIDVMASTLEFDLPPGEEGNAATMATERDMQLSAVTETILGTPGYMAPELFVGESPTTASDIYSLGVLLYEMIAGRLPFVASSVDALLQLRVYDDTEAERLDTLPGVPADVADLVASMLIKPPDRRPSMDEVAKKIQAAQEAATQKLNVVETTPPPLASLSQEIDVFTPRRRRRVLQAATLLTLSIALAGGIFVFQNKSSSSEVPSAAVTPPVQINQLKPKSIRIAMSPMELNLRSYANSSHQVSMSAPTMLSAVLNRADAIHTIPPLELNVAPGTRPGDDDEWRRAAKDAGAMFIVTGSLQEEDGILNATIVVTNTINREAKTYRAKPRPVVQLDALLLELANLMVAEIAPGSSIIAPQDATQRSVDSLILYESALDALSKSLWIDACMQLERIVKEQPEFFEAWYHLAIASAWAAQPTENALRAANKALELAHTERDREVMRVLIHYIQRDMITAAPLATGLAQKYPKDPEVAYIHAETVYHNGYHKKGLRLFNIALDLAPRSKLATVHPIEHALDNGDRRLWERFRSLRLKNSERGVIDLKPPERLRFSLRDYESFTEDKVPWPMQALSVQGRSKEADKRVPKGSAFQGEWVLYALARAVEEDRRKDQKKYFEMIWRKHKADAKVAGNQFRLPFVVGLLSAAGLRKELRTFMGYWDLPGARQIGAQEAGLRAFAAVTLVDPTMIRSEGFLSWREERQATALRAELAGDHEEAAEIWTSLLSDPGQYGGHMQRYALARNLFAMGKQAELEVVCDALVRPKVWVPTQPVYRMRCREWKALP